MASQNTSSSPQASQPDAQASQPDAQASQPDAQVSTPDDPPANPPINDFRTFISFVLTISIFGASTFAIIAGEMTDPADIWEEPSFTLKTVRSFLALSWLGFILALSVAGLSTIVWTLWQQKKHDKKWDKRWKMVENGALALILVLLIGSFLLLSLTLVAYVGTVGWVVVGFDVVVSIIALVVTMLQCW
ncbi:hypothetical protein QBC38DRAFT_253244 [Podospora fimiseda]|uniref:Uncharacterized protein n=1 Tax=Podospora fimiseda TaxID=252190 RepID=A0AAN7BM31_9PEZI|nr:hypothetical protein QBC38DRAFT_253244 [Podospora fimiseda]